LENFFQPARCFTHFNQVTGQGGEIRGDRPHGFGQRITMVDLFQDLLRAMLVCLRSPSRFMFPDLPDVQSSTEGYSDLPTHPGQLLESDGSQGRSPWKFELKPL
jgi:hypothetical protein